MEISDTVPVSTVDPTDVISFEVHEDADTMIKDVVEVKESYFNSDVQWVITGYSHVTGDNVEYFFDPDYDIDIVSEI